MYQIRYYTDQIVIGNLSLLHWKLCIQFAQDDCLISIPHQFLGDVHEQYVNDNHVTINNSANPNCNINCCMCPHTLPDRLILQWSVITDSGTTRTCFSVPLKLWNEIQECSHIWYIVFRLRWDAVNTMLTFGEYWVPMSRLEDYSHSSAINRQRVLGIPYIIMIGYSSICKEISHQHTIFRYPIH